MDTFYDDYYSDYISLVQTLEGIVEDSKTEAPEDIVRRLEQLVASL